MKRQLCALALAGGTGLLHVGCDDRKNNSPRDAGLTEPSPNASILPAPLASGIEAPGAIKANAEDSEHRDAGHTLQDAGAEAVLPEPHALREDQVLSRDSPHETSGFRLTARLRWPDAGPAPRMSEQNADGLQRARDAGTFDVMVDLAGGRMRFALASHAFTLPVGSEFHARDDLYGLALLWPNHTTYTVLAPGALRSVLSQQRADTVPLVHAKVSPLQGGSMLALNTERIELSTPTGKLDLEQARGPNPPSPNAIWESGASLCRLLLELVGAAATTTACRTDLLPLKAEYTWPNGEHFAFEVSRLVRRTDLDPSTLAMPPAGAEFRQSELPPPPPTALLSDSDLSELRVRPAARSERADPSAPKVGLLLVNHSESLRYFSVDGAPAARVPPNAEQLLFGLRAGKYQVTSRDFFSGDDTRLVTLEVPARLTLGEDPEKIH